jgi:hypothetical protein
MLNIQEYRNSIKVLSSNIEEMRVSLWHCYIKWKYSKKRRENEWAGFLEW